MVALLIAGIGCGKDAETPGPNMGVPDAGVPDAAPPGMDGGGSLDGGSDAGTDAPPANTNPFPADPQGGEFAWVVSLSGAGGPVVSAADAAGDLFVVAVQTGEVKLGSVDVPAPLSAGPLLVLKLAPDGKPIWGRSFAAAAKTQPTAAAATAAGDLVIGATTGFAGSFPQVADGFVALLAGSDGATKWSSPWMTGSDDIVTGVAAGLDPAGAPAIYAFGSLGAATTLGGQSLPGGATLARYNDDGTLRWGQSLGVADNLVTGRSLALDHARGPVITGSGKLQIGNQLTRAQRSWWASITTAARGSSTAS